MPRKHVKRTPKAAEPVIDKMVAGDLAAPDPIELPPETPPAPVINGSGPYEPAGRTVMGTQDVVNVERSTSGEYYRMTYNGQSDILDHAPTAGEQTLFVKSCVAARQRAAAALLVRHTGPRDGQVSGGIAVKAL